jgi:hypothetical protein
LMRRGGNRRPDHYDAQRNAAKPHDEPDGTKTPELLALPIAAITKKEPRPKRNPRLTTRRAP